MQHSSKLTLTPQQQAVVDHDTGPALVFAVAGAGKTTAMVHRIERLVRQNIFPPQSILATSFGVGNIKDLNAALSPWPHCRQVQVQTLHALGRGIIERAQTMGCAAHLKLNGSQQSGGDPRQRLLNQTIAAARERDAAYRHELEGLDRADFLDYVDSCKGNLQYANLGLTNLPPSAFASARQAEPPSPALWYYLELYQLYEELRQRSGVVTFADMLLSGWELIAAHEDLLGAMQSRFQAVLVDEYQDINLAQSAMLDLLTKSHGNYMAVGDDDQTIYEWRGAAPRFILNFASKYGARTYRIEENFRSPAGPLLLAGSLIAHNNQRQQKHPRLTRGFEGQTTVKASADLTSMAADIGDEIERLVGDGMPLGDIAVLVRLNAQTPPIEQELIRRRIPYRASQPFYERAEIVTLINYVRLAWLESRLAAGQPVSGAMRLSGIDSWRLICNRPKRYINGIVRKHVAAAIRGGNTPVSQTLRAAAGSISEEWLVKRLLQLADDLHWLAASLEANAGEVLTQLDARLDYRGFLLESSGFPQTAEGRVASVSSFIRYAGGQGSVMAFMAHIKELAESGTGNVDDQEPAVILSTIHRAKGLEWPVVFIPQCNDGIFPFKGALADNLEEERRLFYVALTRTSRHLYLHHLAGEPLSPFMVESRFRHQLPRVDRIAAHLRRTPDRWIAADIVEFLKAVRVTGLQRYFAEWWLPADDPRRAAASQKIQWFADAVSHRNGLAKLSLITADFQPWRLPEGKAHQRDSGEFPGIDRLLPVDKQAEVAPRNGSPLTAAGKSPVVPARPTGEPGFSDLLGQVQGADPTDSAAALSGLLQALRHQTPTIRWVAKSKLSKLPGALLVAPLGELLAASGAGHGRSEAASLLKGIAADGNEDALTRSAAAALLANA